MSIIVLFTMPPEKNETKLWRIFNWQTNDLLSHPCLRLGPFSDAFLSFSLGGAEFEAMSNLARMVAECGPSVEDVVRQKKNRDPDLWYADTHITIHLQKKTQVHLLYTEMDWPPRTKT